MSANTKRALAVVTALCAVSTLLIAAPGCGKKQDSLDVSAPPPSNPNAVPEVAPNKPRPRTPPSMGNPPQQKR